MFEEGIGCAFVNELEVVDDSLDPLTLALDRFFAGKPKERVVAQLLGFLEEAANAPNSDDICLMVHGRDYQAFQLTYGAFDMLRAAGLDYTHYTKSISYIFRPIPGQGPVPPRARQALEEVRKRLEANGSTVPDPVPQPPAESMRQFRVLLQMDPEFFMAGISVDELYQDQLRQQILQSIAPQGENWSWTQRGWMSETQMVDSMKELLPTGSTPIARKQVEEEARRIVGRITDQGLSALVEEELALDPVSGAECERLTTWLEGTLPRGARVRFTGAAAGMLPEMWTMRALAQLLGRSCPCQLQWIRTSGVCIILSLCRRQVSQSHCQRQPLSIFPAPTIYSQAFGFA
jgi:hypothetical protein